LPLARLEREHDQANESLADLRGAIGDESSCTSAHAGMRTIAEAVGRLERSIHEQIYKENRLLFPNLRPPLK
jgi:iron-sulfur cluster repair protein YtfE (RIC family)